MATSTTVDMVHLRSLVNLSGQSHRPDRPLNEIDQIDKKDAPKRLVDFFGILLAQVYWNLEAEPTGEKCHRIAPRDRRDWRGGRDEPRFEVRCSEFEVPKTQNFGSHTAV